MIYFILGVGAGIFLDVFYINFIYLFNCDLFLDLILFKKQRDKLVSCCLKRR